MGRPPFAERMSISALLLHNVEDSDPPVDEPMPVPAPAPAPTTKTMTALERKRAKDRRSQQNKRDRAKQRFDQLTEQVALLKEALSERNEYALSADQLVAQLRADNSSLQLQIAALRSALRAGMDRDALVAQGDINVGVPLWRIPLMNTPPDHRSDSIWQGLLQGVVAKERTRIASLRVPPTASSSPSAASAICRPNLCALIDKNLRSDDEITNTVCDIIRTYPQIGSLTTRVAVANVLIMLLRWQVHLDKESWEQMPEWLRPIQLQMMSQHPTWIDPMPWPKMRKYLIEQEATIDDLAGIYSSSLSINWPYDVKNVLLPTDISSEKAITNPVFFDHIRQLKNWTVGEPFRSRLPKLAAFVDECAKT